MESILREQPEKMVQQGAGSLVRMCLKGFTNKTGKQESDYL